MACPSTKQLSDGSWTPQQHLSTLSAASIDYLLVGYLFLPLVALARLDGTACWPDENWLGLKNVAPPGGGGPLAPLGGGMEAAGSACKKQ